MKKARKCAGRYFSLIVVFLITTSSAFSQKVEAENGVLTGTSISSTRSGYSGSGYVTGFDSDNDAVSMTINVAATGLYDLFVGYAAPSGEKTNDIYVNEVFAGSQIFPASSTFKESHFGKINLTAGNNKIKIVKNWGYFEVDFIRVEPTTPNEIDNYSEELINANASYEANILYRYLRDLYGHRILSGQQADAGGTTELNYIQQKTGKLPAIKGFDLIDYSPSRVENGTTSMQTERSIDWWDDGGVVSMLWHWNAPKDLIDEPGMEWWRGFYTEATTFDLSIAMNDPESEEYELIIRDIDVIAEELLLIEAANTPLLWRPLHEAEGGWFWWGAKGPEPCVWLWKLMYERLTDHHGLDNLIWVWTGTNSEAALDWYPGDDYVDIVGADIYLNDKNYSPSFSLFDDMAGVHEGKKILAMSETGTIPDASALDDEKARWSWFCTWSGDFIMSGIKNEVSHINKVYNHEYVITFDELPDFYNYESPDFPEEEIILSAHLPNTINVYPNPTTHHLNFDIDDSAGEFLISLYDLKGSILLELTKEQAEHGISMLNYQKGLYIVRISSSNWERVVKVQKL